MQHLRTLEELVPKYQEGSFWDDEEQFLPYLCRFADKEIFPSSERLEEVLQEPQSDLRALDLAIEAEEKFAEYFHRAAGAARTADGRDAFAWLAAEEDRHAAVLKERKAQLEKSSSSRA